MVWKLEYYNRLSYNHFIIISENCVFILYAVLQYSELYAQEYSTTKKQKLNI